MLLSSPYLAQLHQGSATPVTCPPVSLRPWQRQLTNVRTSAATVDENATADGGNGGVGGGRVVETELRVEAERSYMAYAMSVIVGRALPDVRDGLKPVQRRILYAASDLGLSPTKPHRKCARLVGEVLGKYHPHGDASVYDALVRLAQDFSMRAPLINGHGNFGSVDDDPPAAMRYTECRLQPLTASALMADLEADTVDFLPNFDASQEEPSVLPARLPQLLLNGASGIAVGIATKIPPHNMHELVAGVAALIENPDITVQQLMRHIPAPDFPTGGQILVTDGVRDAYETGRGSIVVRGKCHIEEGVSSGGNGASAAAAAAAKKKGKGPGKPLVVITELPYQTYKALLVENIARLVEEGVLTGVSDVRDESDRTGMRVVVEAKRGGSAELVRNALYKHTALQGRFAVNAVALVGGQPRSLSLKQLLEEWLAFRCDVVSRRSRFQLAKATARLHLVEGFLHALGAMDDVIRLIRTARDAPAASAALQSALGLSAEQAGGVLGMSLGRLTGLEEGKLRGEQAELTAKIGDLNALLGSRDRVLGVVLAEAQEVAGKHGDARRSELVADGQGAVEMRSEDIIPNNPCLITLSKKGYIKRMPAETFAVQGRGGRGKAGASLKGDDSMDFVLNASSHDHLLLLTHDGLAHRVQAFNVPEASRTAAGTAVAQVLPNVRGNSVAAMLAVSEFAERDFLLLLTERGLIKKTSLAAFASMKARGLSAVKLKKGDRLLAAEQCSSDIEVLCASSGGNLIRFRADDEQLRPMTRLHAGVTAMRLKNGCRIVGMSVIPPSMLATAGEASKEGPWVLLVTKAGLGKRVPLAEFSAQARGGVGIIGARLNEGDELALLQVVEAGVEQDIIVATGNGLLVRTKLAGVPVVSRTAKGSRLVKVAEGDEVQAVILVLPDEAIAPS